MRLKPASGAFALLAVATVCLTVAGSLLVRGAPSQTRRSWDELPVIAMKGGLQAFWNVTDRTKGENDAEAMRHGFAPLTILGTYADYPGNQKEHIGNFLGKKPANPWLKPPFFERIIRRNILDTGTSGTFVNDIEVDFSEDMAKAFADESVRAASGASDPAAFEEAYLKEWASWFWLPSQWTREIFPGTKVGIYGPQPFRRDYWGIAGKDAAQIDGTHRNDWRMWQYIDPHVDFYVASIYPYYAAPDTVFYMAANVEENFLRTRPLGDKPVYAYEWLRYHSGNWREGNREIDPYVAAAMAIVPYFSGARAAVLWGYEPELKPGDGRPYDNLPLYMENLARVAGLSEKIGRGQLVIDEPAHQLWDARHPLVRRIIVSPGECIVMAVNPWQGDGETSFTKVTCGGRTVEIPMRGKHTGIFDVEDGIAVAH